MSGCLELGPEGNPLQKLRIEDSFVESKLDDVSRPKEDDLPAKAVVKRPGNVQLARSARDEIRGRS